MRYTIVVLSVLAGALLPAEAAAQRRGGAVEVAVGRSEYDLSGTGSGNVVAIRADLPITRRFLIQPSLTYLADDPEFERDFKLYLPEVQAQFEPLRTRVRPFLGVGAGFAWESLPVVDDEFEATLSTAVGVRANLTRGWGAVGELRVRAVRPWTGTTADLTIGVARRL